MKKQDRDGDEMRRYYDFSGGVRGKYAKRYAEGTNVVVLDPDIWAGHHTEYFDLAGKSERAKTEGVKAWIDPEGYRRFIAGKRRAFEDEVDKEMGAPTHAAK